MSSQPTAAASRRKRNKKKISGRALYGKADRVTLSQVWSVNGQIGGQPLSFGKLYGNKFTFTSNDIFNIAGKVGQFFPGEIKLHSAKMTGHLLITDSLNMFKSTLGGGSFTGIPYTIKYKTDPNSKNPIPAEILPFPKTEADLNLTAEMGPDGGHYIAGNFVTDSDVKGTASFTEPEALLLYPGVHYVINSSDKPYHFQRTWKPTEPSETEWFTQDNPAKKIFDLYVAVTAMSSEGKWIVSNLVRPVKYAIILKVDFNMSIRGRKAVSGLPEFKSSPTDESGDEASFSGISEAMSVLSV